MSFDPQQFRECIIEPVLHFLDLYSPAAVELLMGTAAQESHFGTYLKQIDGPALGIYQIEPATHRDLWDNFLTHRRDLSAKLGNLTSAGWPLDSKERLIGNLYYATAVARLIYYRDPQPLPAHDDLPGLAAYWKRVYNTAKGKGTVKEFLKNYRRLVLGNKDA